MTGPIEGASGTGGKSEKGFALLGSVNDTAPLTLFGGFAPLIATSLIAMTGDKLAPSYYVMASSILSIAAILALTYSASTARRIRAAEPG